MSASLVGSEMCIRDSPERGSRRLLEAARNCLKQLQTAVVNLPMCSCLLYTSTLPTICSV
eukprot:9661781-Alexandrium_andersonii.AAC.1